VRITNKHLPWIKAAFHISAMLPLIILLWQVVSDSAGGDPVQYIIHYTGIGGLNTLIAMLLLSPIAKRFKQGALVQTRRLVGLYVFFYATLHIFAYLSLDLLFEWSLLFQETFKRPYILIGALAYLILIALSVTSINWLKRKMGKRWQQLHNSVYLVTLLVPIHYYWSVKSEVIEPALYILACIALLALRVKRRRTNNKNSTKPYRKQSTYS